MVGDGAGSAEPPPHAKAKAKAKAKAGPRGHDWRKFEVEKLGQIVWDPYEFSYAAHCKTHGPGCRINRVVSKKPLGYLPAWLQAQTLPEYGTTELHMAARLDRSDNSPVSFHHRVEAREWLKTIPGSADLFAREPGGGDEEPVKL